MKKAIFPGSFCPFTNGHLSVVERAGRVFDSITVLVCQNEEKKYFLTAEQRLTLVKEAIKNIENADAILYSGLVAEYAKENSAVIVKGIRNAGDFVYEDEMAKINYSISGAETLFIPCREAQSHISSTAVRELIKYGKDFSGYVPDAKLLSQMISK